MRLVLPERIAKALRQSELDIVVTGAGGWLGAASLELIADALGPAEFEHRVHAFAERPRWLRLVNGVEILLKRPDVLDRFETGPCLMLHYAFLGREKLAAMTPAAYIAANEAISARARRAIGNLRPRGVFLTSSGAVYGADGAVDSDLAGNPYGVLKHRDEIAFAEACRRTGAVLATARIFNLSGPYINKLAGYALACFIRDALAGRPIAVRANRRVERSYVAIGDVLALALAALLDPRRESVSFETAGERVVEVGELAALVRDGLGRDDLAIERPPLDPALPAERYVGDPTAMRALAARHGIGFEDLPSQIRRTADYLKRFGHVGPQ
jgi:UDP-glucuronate decarboxylase